LKYIELQKHINDYLNKAGVLAPVYMLFGDDEYLISQAIKMFEALIDPEFASFNISRFLKDTDMLDVIDSLNTFPMFDDKKLVLLEGKVFKDEEKNELSKYFEEYNSQAIFVVYFYPDSAKKDENAKRNAGVDSLAKLRVKNQELVDCSVLDGFSLSNEIIRLCATAPSIEIDSDAIQELVTRTQSKMSRIVTEISKLKSYSEGKITKKDVIELVQEDLDFKGYEFAQAVSEKNSDKALEILNVFLKAGYTTATILSILYDKYRKMLHSELNKTMSNDELGKYINLSGGAVYYLRKVSSNYTQVKLKKCVDYLHEIQCGLREGIYAEEAALHNVVLSMLNM